MYKPNKKNVSYLTNKIFNLSDREIGVRHFKIESIFFRHQDGCVEAINVKVLFGYRVTSKSA